MTELVAPDAGARADTNAPIPYPATAERTRRPDIGPWLRGLPFPLLPFLLFCILLEIVPVIVLIRDSLRVQGLGDNSRVTVMTREGGADSSETAKRMLGLLQNELR